MAVRVAVAAATIKTSSCSLFDPPTPIMLLDEDPGTVGADAARQEIQLIELSSSSIIPSATSISSRINKPSRASMTRSLRCSNRATCASETPRRPCANSPETFIP